MVVRIKPVSRVRRGGGRVRRLAGEAAAGPRPPLDLGHSWVPAVDIIETPAALVLEAEMPGFSARDITIALQASRIEIRGLKAEGEVPPGARYLRLEREFGSFRRSVALPCAVLPARARATLENGLLIVIMRKDRTRRGRDYVVKVRKTGG